MYSLEAISMPPHVALQPLYAFYPSVVHANRWHACSWPPTFCTTAPRPCAMPQGIATAWRKPYRMYSKASRCVSKMSHPLMRILMQVIGNPWHAVSISLHVIRSGALIVPRTMVRDGESGCGIPSWTKYDHSHIYIYISSEQSYLQGW